MCRVGSVVIVLDLEGGGLLLLHVVTCTQCCCQVLVTCSHLVMESMDN
jgi:hypothetical protein